MGCYCGAPSRLFLQGAEDVTKCPRRRCGAHSSLTRHKVSQSALPSTDLNSTLSPIGVIWHAEPARNAFETTVNWFRSIGPVARDGFMPDSVNSVLLQFSSVAITYRTTCLFSLLSPECPLGRTCEWLFLRTAPPNRTRLTKHLSSSWRSPFCQSLSIEFPPPKFLPQGPSWPLTAPFPKYSGSTGKDIIDIPFVDRGPLEFSSPHVL